jgi:hypothetical protein
VDIDASCAWLHETEDHLGVAEPAAPSAVHVDGGSIKAIP